MNTVFSRLLLLIAAFIPYVATSSTLDPPSDPVRLIEIVGPRTIGVGAVGHFRARVAEQSGQPVNYLWDLGDGTLSMGTLVSYAYAAPGTYTITVVARNAAGRDTLTAPVYVAATPPGADSVVAAPEEETKDAVVARSSIGGETVDVSSRARITVPRKALYGSGGIVAEKGGYAWVVATDLWSERARDRMMGYRLLGYRADIYVETAGRGSPAHRIVLGQFATKGEALAARPWLPDNAANPWLLELSVATKGLSAEQ